MFTPPTGTSGVYADAPSAQHRSLPLRLLQWGLFPAVFLIGVAASAAIYNGAVDAMTAQMSVFALAVITVYFAQHVIPFRHDWLASTPQERRVDISSWVMLMLLVDPLLKRAAMPALMALTVTLAHPTGGLGWFPVDLPVALQLLLAATIAEFGQYWMHRAAHSNGWMWTVHSMHHSPERVSLANGFRTNPINMVWHQMAGLFVLMLIGTPAPILHMLILLSTVIGVFQHANADLRYDGWNWIFGTADLHRWHHAAQTHVAYCNFGQNLVLWDQVFATYRRAQHAEPSAVGIEGVSRSTRGYFASVLASTFGKTR